MIIPHTDIRLIKCPLTLNNKNQLTFTTKAKQEEYFLSLAYEEDDNAQYQRKDGVIRFNRQMDDIIEYNYCMYKNENYSNKWFYAFVIGMKYINDNMTEVSIITDVFQTWQFDIIYKQSFIEREIVPVASDTPGNYLYPEGLEFGEAKVNATADLDELIPIYIIAYTRNPYDDGLTTQVPTSQGIIINGVPNGMFFWVGSVDMLQGMLENINRAGFGDSILAIFSVPALSFVGFMNWTLSDITSGSVSYWVVSDFKANAITKTFNARPTSIDSYTPRNKKLLTYPYLYLGFNPPNGSSKIYRYEDFTNATPSFKLMSEVNVNPSVIFVPQNYRGATEGLQDTSVLQGYPSIGWVTDYFNSWLAQNSEIVNLQMEQETYNYKIDAIKGGLNMVSNMSSMMTGGDSSSIASGMLGFINNTLNLASLDRNHDFYVKNQMAQIEKQQLLPNSGKLSGSNATLLGYGLIDNSIFNRYSIKQEYAKKIDKFFDMYGYLINELKAIDINNRPNWNYVKTIGANLLGDIPQVDLQALKDMFDNGVTFWHNPSTFLDYSQNNRTS